MQAIILSAGLGTRLQPLTHTIPKPMVSLAGRPLLQHQVERLVSLGCRNIVINHSRFGKSIEEFFGDGNRFRAQIVYSSEGDKPMGTAAGVRKALPLLDSDKDFMLVSADAICDFPSLSLPEEQMLAHLLLVPPPSYRSEGDFFLQEGRISTRTGEPCVYSGIGLFRHELFITTKERDLASVLKRAEGRVSGQWHQGYWMDVGTPERLRQAENFFENKR